MNTEIFKKYYKSEIQQKLKHKIKDEEETASKTTNVWLAEIRIERIIGGGAVYPERITRGGGG